jgi:beta-galactosidase
LRLLQGFINGNDAKGDIIKKGGRMLKKICAAVFVALIMTAVCFAETYTGEPSGRVKINLGATPWKFLKLDPPNAQNPTGVNEGPWATVGIPHTWGDTLSFLNMASGGPGDGYDATTWYRKHFTLDNSYSGKKIFIEFRGAGTGAQVYINSKLIPGNDTFNLNATHVGTFIPFIVDITPYAKFGADTNVLAVRVSSTGAFYTDPQFAKAFKYGMECVGLYRPVYMHICNKVYVPANVYSVVNNWGTYVAALTATSTDATVEILTHVKNESGAAQAVTLTTKVVDQTNTVVWSQDRTQTINADSSFVFNQTADITSPHLWYPNNSIYGKPYLYKVYHIVKVGGTTVDVFQSPLGIRVITWDKDFPIINGHPHYLWGGASRYDYPALGCAQTEEQQWRDAKIMADCGGSLWRPGHATASGEFTEGCDQFGVMIMQPSGDIEGTLQKVTPYQYEIKEQWHRDMLVRDRNNPSILAWEVSNGPIDAALEEDIRIKIDSVWDPVHTRAMSDRGYWLAVPEFNKGIVSIISCSGTGCEVPFHQINYPNIPSWGAEAWTGSGTSFRFNYDGELAFANEYVNNWRNSKKAKCFGLVQWYMAETPGENGIGRSFGTAMMDWNRIPKMLYYIYQACWTNYAVKPVVRLARGGGNINAFSNCPSVRLRINGTDQGTRTPYPDTVGTAMLPRQCSWNVGPSGTVRAEGLDAGGNVVCFDERKMPGAPAGIQLTVEAPIVKPCDGDTFKIYANGSDAAFILATIVDAQGNWCLTSSPNVTFSVSGPGNYRGGADNNTSGGGVFTHSPGDHELTAEGGMCKVAVRSTFTPGTVTVSATSGGLSGSTTFTTVEVPRPDTVSLRGPIARQSSALMPVFRMTAGGGMIRYFVSQDATISTQVLDASGRLVQQTAPAALSRGWHTLMEAAPAAGGDARGNGIYFVRFSVDGGYKCIKRVVLMK